MHTLIMIIIAGFLYAIQYNYYEKNWKKGLTASVSYNKSHARIGDTVKVSELVSNHKSLPLPMLHVKFKTSRTFEYVTRENSSVTDHYYRNDVFSILGNQQVKRTLTFRTTKRGYFVIDSVNFVMKDLFLHHSDGYNLPNHSALYVYPRLLNGRKELTLSQSLIGDILTKSLQSDPLSFRGIRNYTPQDEMRFINWKATARQQELMVNTYFDTQTTSVMFLVNFDTNSIRKIDAIREIIAQVTATLMESMNAQHFSMQFVTNANDIVTNQLASTEMGSGSGHLQTMNENLARLNLAGDVANFHNFFEGEQSRFNETMKKTSYIIISNYRKSDLLEDFYAKQQEGYQVYLICPDERKNFTENELALQRITDKNGAKSISYKKLKDTYFWEVHTDDA